jgi:putative iron-dependent peroxidase
MAGAITIVDEVHGFKFFDMRDLLGSSTAPRTPTARRRERQPDPDGDFAGGSYVHVQKYTHDMARGRR